MPTLTPHQETSCINLMNPATLSLSLTILKEKKGPRHRHLWRWYGSNGSGICFSSWWPDHDSDGLKNQAFYPLHRLWSPIASLCSNSIVRLASEDEVLNERSSSRTQTPSASTSWSTIWHSIPYQDDLCAVWTLLAIADRKEGEYHTLPILWKISKRLSGEYRL